MLRAAGWTGPGLCGPMSSLPLVRAALPTRAQGSMITEAQLPSKKANRSCSPNKAEAAAREQHCSRRLGFTGVSDLAGPRARISPPVQPL